MDFSTLDQEALVREGYVSKTIDGVVYSAKLIPAIQGVALGNRLIQAALPAIGAWKDGVDKADTVSPEEESMYTDIAILISTKLGDLGVEDIFLTLTNEMKVDGLNIDFDSQFRGKYDVLLEVITFCIKENFGDFFTSFLKNKGIDLQKMVGDTLQGVSETPTAEVLETQGIT